jgi:hypothetical protein
MDRAARAALGGLFLLVGAGEASAAEGEREGRVFVEVAAWRARAGTLDTDYAFFDPSGTLSGGGEIQSLSYETDRTLRLRAGWTFGAGARVSATMFAHEAGGRGSTGVHPGQIGALLASPDFAIGRSLVDSAASQSSIRATEIGVEFAWEVARAGRGRLEVGAGLCALRFERTTAATYEATDFSGRDLLEIVNVSTDARGVGPEISLRFEYPASGRASFFATGGVALAVGDLEATATDSAFVDGSFDRATVAARTGLRRAFPAFEGALGARGRIAGSLFGFLEYRAAYWAGLARLPRFVDDVSQNTTVSSGESLSLEGFSLGFAYEF